MKILYCAIDQTVPGTKGGSVHVAAVAEGLAALGHDVQALVTPGHLTRDAGPPGLTVAPARAPDVRGRDARVRWTPLSPPLGINQLRWMRAPAIRRIAQSFKPDVVIERYYNFGGEGIAAARTVGATAVLEVNAPVIDHPGSAKAALDRALLLQPMRRWRERLVRHSDLVVTPSAAILPPGTPAGKIVELEWGADTDRFRPDAQGEVPFARPPGTLAIFAGAFRSWHGAIHLVHAIRELRARGDRTLAAAFIGDGPELPRVREAAGGLDRIVFTGALPHVMIPACLAAADIGVAPFDMAAHPPLSLGFYWSPLKIFEYMAAGLPVVAPAVDRIPALVSDEREGLLYEPRRPGALADALARLTDAALRQRLGTAARERALAQYSWAAHCRALERAIIDRRG